MVKAQSEMGNAIKDKVNRFFDNAQYSSLESVREATLEALNNNGLSIQQYPSLENGMVKVTTLLAHTSGQYIESDAYASVASTDAQKVGSAISYLRRYSWSSVCGITNADDDDGNAASAQPVPVQNNAYKQSKPIEKLAYTLISDDEKLALSLIVGDKGEWAIPFGKNKGKLIKDLSDRDLQSFSDWLMKSGAEKGSMNENAKMFVIAAEQFLATKPKA